MRSRGWTPSSRRIKVNRDHVRDRVVGKAVRFHPSRNEGLVAELQIANTTEGNDTLELANDGLLAASAGFGVPDGGETWPERTLRRLTRVWLDHIAMTPDPAYDGTEPIDVRDIRRRHGAGGRAAEPRRRLRVAPVRPLCDD